MYFFVLAAWLAGTLFSFSNGNRKLPLVMLLLGLGFIFAPIGAFKIAGLALLAAITWIANKYDMS